MVERLVITTACRGSEKAEPSGYVYLLELESGRVVSRTPMIEAIYRELDPNPRGGMRGARGIAVTDERVFVANLDTIFCFDHPWRMTGSISHPSCADIHEFLIRDGYLWVASSRNDFIFRFDLDGHLLRHIDLRRFPKMSELSGLKKPSLLDDEKILSGEIDLRDPRSHDWKKYDAFHLNSLCFLPGGEMLVMAGIFWSGVHNLIRDLKNNLWKVRQNLPMKPPRPRGQSFRPQPAFSTRLNAALKTQKSAVLKIDGAGWLESLLVLKNVYTPIHSLFVEGEDVVLFTDSNRGEIVRLEVGTGKVLSRMMVSDEFMRGILGLPGDLLAVGGGALSISSILLDKGSSIA